MRFLPLRLLLPLVLFLPLLWAKSPSSSSIDFTSPPPPPIEVSASNLLLTPFASPSSIVHSGTTPLDPVADGTGDGRRRRKLSIESSIESASRADRRSISQHTFSFAVSSSSSSPNGALTGANSDASNAVHPNSNSRRSSGHGMNSHSHFWCCAEHSVPHFSASSSHIAPERRAASATTISVCCSLGPGSAAQCARPWMGEAGSGGGVTSNGGAILLRLDELISCW
jgi:hypothetical protein